MTLGGLTGLAEWMSDLRFYVLFNNISVISGYGRLIMKCIVQWNPVYEPGTARSIGYRLIYIATGALVGGLSGKSQEDVGRPLTTLCDCRTVPTARCTRG